MKRNRFLSIYAAAIAFMSCRLIQAQDLTGDWQGTLKQASPYRKKPK